MRYYATTALKAAALGLPLSLGAVTAQAADLADTIQRAGGLATFYRALQETDVLDTLRGGVPMTVFAPADTAFEALPGETVAALFDPENRDALRTLLGYHIVQGARIGAAELPAEVATASGTLYITPTDARAAAAEVEADNGVLHVVDHMLVPDAVIEALLR